MVAVLSLVWIVVTFESAHEVEGRNALLCVVRNAIFDVHECTSLHKLISILVHSSILVVYLHLMERVVTHSASMYDKSALCNAAHLLLLVLFVVVVMV